MSRSLGLFIFCLLMLSGPGTQSAEAQMIPGRSTSRDKALEQRAASLARLGRTEEAVDLYLELLYKNPGNSNMYFRVSSLMPGAGNAPTLLQILDDILKTQSKNTRLAADRGRLLYIMDRKEEALSDWQQLKALNRNDRFAYTTITNAMLQAGATSEAIDLLVEGRTTLNDPLAFAFDLARLYTARHKYDMASKEFLAHLDRNPGMLDHISNQLIRMLENDGAAEAIESSFSQILGTPGDHKTLVLAQAKLLLHQKQYAACTSTILRSDLKTSLRDIFSIANDLLAEQAWGPAADLYLFISSNSEDKKQVGEALLKLASTYENRLQPESSYTSLSGYFQGNQFLDLDLRISLNKDASLERTLKLYDSLQTLLPRTYEAFQASYHIANIQLMISGDVDRAIRGFDNIFEKAPKRDLRLAGGLRLVDAWLVRGDTTKANEVLDTITSRLNMDEDDAPIIASRVKIRIHQGDIPALNKELLNLSGASSPLDPIFNDGLEIMALIEGNGEMDDSQLALYFKAEQFIQQHKLIEAVDVLTQTRGESTSIADEAHVRAINILLTLGDFEPAVKLMDSFLDSYPDSDWRPNVLIWKAEQLQFTDLKPQAAVPFYEEVIIHYPGYLGIQDVRTRLRGLLGAGS